MATIEDLHVSISDMSTSSALNLILEMRQRRRTPLKTACKKPRKAKTVIAKSVKGTKGLKNSINKLKLSKKQALIAELLAMMEE